MTDALPNAPTDYRALFDLTGRRALVVGAGSGIGEAVAQGLAAFGANVTCADVNLEAAERVATGVGEAVQLDVTDAGAVERVVGELDALDILVLNAAMLGSLSPVPSIDGKEFNRILTLNVLANQALIAGFDPMLRRSADGKLLAVTSSVGRGIRVRTLSASCSAHQGARP